MGSPFTTEIEARARLADRKRELGRVDEQGWWEHPLPKPGRFRALLRGAGARVLRVVARVAATPPKLVVPKERAANGKDVPLTPLERTLRCTVAIVLGGN